MKRMLMVLTLAALFVVGMVVAAFPASADPDCTTQAGGNPNCVNVNGGGQTGGCSNNPTCEKKFKP